MTPPCHKRRGALGIHTDLGRAYAETEREMLTALCLARPDFISVESPKDTPSGSVAPMEGIIAKCEKGKKLPEVAYIYEAKVRNISAEKLFGEYRGRGMVGSGKMMNLQRASLLFGVPSLLLYRIPRVNWFLVLRVTNGDGTFTFKWNQKLMRVRDSILGGWNWEWQTFVPMNDAKRVPI